MKTKSLISIVLALFFLPMVVFGQDSVEKFYADDGRNFGGDVIIKKSTVKIDGNLAYRIFEVEAPEAGQYYLSAWLMAATTDKGPREYKVQINSSEHLTLKPEKANWQSVTFRDETQNPVFAELSAGLNTIAFLTQVPEIPQVEIVRLSRDPEKANIPGTEYEAFLNNIKKETELRKNNPTPERDTLQSLKNGIILPNPEGNYYHHIEATFKYTFYTTVYLQAGQQAFFATNADNFKHVLEVFSSSKTESYSWVATSGSGSLASINVNIPYTDVYFVRVRAYWQNEQGLVNLNVNGQYYYEDCTASGWAGFRHFHTTPVEYNYFTCHINGDTRLWIEDSGLPGRIIGWNDDYYGSGDFFWGVASRVKKDFNTDVGAVLFSSYSSITPTGTCDLYIKCQNSTIASSFPNLEADDAIQSAPASGAYNCISWSGGITDDWHWPPTDYGLPWWSGDDLVSFENYYDYNRYGGCDRYTRTGATSSNASIALWYNSNYCAWDLDNYGSWYYKCGNYTHGSVRKPANNHPHGYNWESKPGGFMRTFHPRDALYDNSNDGYGNISEYFQKITTKSSSLLTGLTLRESVNQGLSEIEVVNFNQQEEDKLIKMKEKIAPSVVDEFELKYLAWKNTWQNPEILKHSNPRMYAMSKEYEEFIDFCKLQGTTVWVLVFDKFRSGDYFARNAIEDLTFPAFFCLMDSVRQENINQTQLKSGKVLVHTSEGSWNKYIKKLLGQTTSELQYNTVTSNKEIGIDDLYKPLEVYPNPVSDFLQIKIAVRRESRINITMYDITGKLIAQIVTNEKKETGWHTIGYNVGKYPSGTYIIKYQINGNLYVEKIQISR